MHANATTARNVTYDVVPGYRRTALGETYQQVVHAFHHHGVFTRGAVFALAIVLLLAEAFLQLLVAGNQLAHDCAEPYASVTYRSVHFVDVVEHVTFACGGNCVRGKQIRRQESAVFTVAFHHGFSGADVFFLKLALEKLSDFCLCRRRCGNFYPVA